MKRLYLLYTLMLGGLLIAAGCSSGDPNMRSAQSSFEGEDYDAALQSVNAALETSPADAEALVLKGQILQEMAANTTSVEERSDLIGQMVQAYNQAVEADSGLQGDIQNRLAFAYVDEFQKGVQAFQQGETDSLQFLEAAEYFDNAAAIQPDSAGAFINQAFALLNAGRPGAAIEPFEQAIEGGENEPDIYIYLADLYSMEEQPERAVTLLEQAREQYPENQDIQAQLLNAYIRANQLDRAMQIYGEAVEEEPSNQLYRYNYGSLLLEAEQYDQAIEQLSEAVELDPQYANAWYNLGAAYVNKAVSVNDQVSQMDDSLRTNRTTMDQSAVAEMETEMESLTEERRELFAEAIPPLERAKELTEGEGGETLGICQALFSAYAQTGQDEKAETVAECAGYDLN